MTANSDSPRAAALAILAGMFTLGLTDNLVALIADTSSLSQFHLLRGSMVLIALSLVAAMGGGTIWPKRPVAVLARSTLTAGAMLIYFGCIALLPIGIVVAGLFTAPLFVLLIEVVLQGKRVGVLRGLAIALGFAGALLVIRPTPGNLDLVSLLPILAGLLYAGGAVATRAWCEGESTVCLAVFFFALLALAGAAGVAFLPGEGSGSAGFPLRGWMPLNAPTLGWFVVLSTGALVGIYCIFRGYQLGEASFVAVFEYSLLVFASVWAFILWGETLPPLAFAGMALIATAGVILAMRGRAR